MCMIHRDIEGLCIHLLEAELVDFGDFVGQFL